MTALVIWRRDGKPQTKQSRKTARRKARQEMAWRKFKRTIKAVPWDATWEQLSAVSKQRGPEWEQGAEPDQHPGDVKEHAWIDQQLGGRLAGVPDHNKSEAGTGKSEQRQALLCPA